MTIVRRSVQQEHSISGLDRYLQWQTKFCIQRKKNTTLLNKHRNLKRAFFVKRFKEGKKATGIITAAGSRSMKRNLDTGVEVNNNERSKEGTTPCNKRETKYVFRYI